MPEENFEQQARRKAEEFGMEPNADVWLRVQAAIRPERRRRVLWWWLLPLCVVGIVAGLFMRNGKAVTEGKRDVPGMIHDKGTGTAEPETHMKPLEKEAAVAAGKTSETADGRKLQRGVNEEIQSSFIANKKTDSSSSGNKETRKNHAEISEPVFSDVVTGGVKERVQTAGSEGEKTPVPLQNSTDGQMVVSDSVYSQVAEDAAANPSAKSDSLHRPADVNKELVKKKTGAKKWQTGIMAEMGMASWGKELFASEAGKTGQYAIIPANADTIDSLMSNTSESRQTKNGLDAAIGFTVRKEIGKNFYISSQLGYRYQQYEAVDLRTSYNQMQFLTSTYFVSKNNYHSHFLALSISAGRKLFVSKFTSLSAEAGVDNSWLFIFRQNTEQSSFFTSTGKSLTTIDFYRWQPHVVVSVPFDWHKAGSTRFLLSPFARIGLHSFQKNGNGYSNNHLVSAGIQAVYYFK